MKSILMSIQPYWGFLIIAKAKGWDLAKYGLHKKTVEVRKGVPASPDWDGKAALYFLKDKKSLARIPEEYRGEVEKLCGKVVGEFVCDCITDLWADNTGFEAVEQATCLTYEQFVEYGKGAPLFGWHISDLKIYDKPKELSEFRKPRKCPITYDCFLCKYWSIGMQDCTKELRLTRPPQSFCYVEKLDV